MEWAMGVVEKLHESQDESVHRGLRTRAVQRLYNLEMSDGQVPEVSVEDKGETTSVVKRPTRKGRVPIKFDDSVCNWK